MADSRKSDNSNRHIDDLLSPLVYQMLKAMAARQLGQQQGDLTLHPTALVHEAYLKLSASASLSIQDQSHFFAVAARAMRQVFIDYLRQRTAAKHIQNASPITLATEKILEHDQKLSYLELDSALDALATFDRLQASIIELRFSAATPSPRPPRFSTYPSAPPNANSPLPGCG